MVGTVGRHVLVELWGCNEALLSDRETVEAVLTQAVCAAGATLLSSHFHEFPGGGVTGVSVCGESHITAHTWPEAGYAACDVFLCGDHDPFLAVPVLQSGFKAGVLYVAGFERGGGGMPQRIEP
jgi:S-adenosylmethionine decarboxylase